MYIIKLDKNIKKIGKILNQINENNEKRNRKQITSKKCIKEKNYLVKSRKDSCTYILFENLLLQKLNERKTIFKCSALLNMHAHTHGCINHKYKQICLM